MSKHAQRMGSNGLDRQPRQSALQAPARQRSVAVVDDDPFFRRSLQRLLATMGFDVSPFGSAEEFLDYPYKKRFHCLLLDFHLPGMSGIDLLSRLDKAGYSVPVILISSDPSVSWPANGASNRVEMILNKPVNAEELGSALTSTLLSSADR